MPTPRFRSVRSRAPSAASPHAQATFHAPTHRLPTEPGLLRLEMTLPAWTDDPSHIGDMIRS